MKTKPLKLNKDLPSTPRLCVSARAMSLILCLLFFDGKMGLAQTGSLEVDGKLKVNQDLRANGVSFLWNNTLKLGHLNAPNDEASAFDVVIEDGGAATMTIRTNRGGANFVWSHPGQGVWHKEMMLTYDGVLSLYPLKTHLETVAADPGIVMNPNGTGSILINGKKVLTGGNGSQNPLAIGSSNWGGDNIASSEFAFAVGSENVASGNGSIALGGGNTVSGYRSMGLGQENKVSNSFAAALGYFNTASGNSSVAMGWNNRAIGDRSFAVGEANQANSIYAISMGNGNIVSGIASAAFGQSNQTFNAYSAAIGFGNKVGTATVGSCWAIGYGCESTGGSSLATGWYTKAAGRLQFVMGSKNIAMPSNPKPGGDPGDTDALFIIGNGNPVLGPDAVSNAFLVRWNGDTTVYGNLDSTKKITAQDITATGKVIIQPQGDLSMGEFTAGGQ